MKNNKLHNIKSTGFKAPNNYFETFDEKLYAKLKGKSKLSTVKTTGFKVPNGYFETVDDKVLNAIHTQKQNKTIALFSWKKAAYTTAVAASLILMFNIFSNTTKEVNFESIETTTVENYIINQDISAYDVATLLEDNTLDDINYVEFDFSEETMETFLIDNIDLEDLESLYK